MSDQSADPYADHEEMANHWWWRPGWKVGTRFYAWHITLDGQDDLHRLVDEYQDALKPFRTLDPIPRRWRHITLQGLGHVEDVTDQQRDEAVQAVRERVAKLDPIESIFERAVIFHEAIALPPSEPEVIAHLRNEIRAGITEAWGWCPENAEGFRAHTSIAYSNAAALGTPIRQVLDGTPHEPARLRSSQLALIRMHRDAQMYEWQSVSDVTMASS